MPITGTGQRPNSGPRARSVIPTPQGPTKRSRVVANAVPEIIPTGAGLANLGESLSTFFNNLGNTLEKATDAQNLLAMQGIKEENRLAQNAGRRDALLGESPANKGAAYLEGYNAVKTNEAATKRRRDALRAEGKLRKRKEFELSTQGKADALRPGGKPDPTLIDKEEYIDAYKRQKGILAGQEKYAEWRELLAGLSPNDDVEATFKAFVDAALKNGNQFGVGDDIFDAAFLGTLHSMSAAGRVAGRLHAQKQKAVVLLGEAASVLITKLVEGQPVDAVAAIRSIRTSMPTLTEGEAAAKFADVLLGWIQRTGSAKDATTAIRLLSESGFEKRNNKAFQALRQKFRKAAQNTTTAEGNAAYVKIASTLLDLKQNTDPNNTRALMAGARSLIVANFLARQRYGGQGGQFKSNMTAIQKFIEPIAQRNTEVNRARDTRLRGGTDNKLELKHFDFNVAQRGGVEWINAKPIEFAQFLQNHGIAGGVISPSVRVQLTENIVSGDATKFASTMTSIQSVIAMNDKNLATGLGLTNGAAHTIIKFALNRRKLFGQSWEQIRTVALAGAEKIRALKEKGALNFKNVVGMEVGTGSVAKARETVETLLRSELKDKFKGLVFISDPIIRMMSGALLEDWVASGGQEWKGLTKALVATAFAGGRFHLVPGTSGSVSLERLLMPRAGTILEDSPPGADFVSFPTVVAVPFGTEVMSPAGQTQNTIDTWELDKSTLYNAIYAGRVAIASDVSLNGNRPAWAHRGVYMVMTNGSSTTFTAGDVLEINGVKITLADDIEERAFQLKTAGLFNPTVALTKARLAQEAEVTPLTIATERQLQKPNAQERSIGNRFVLVEESGVLILGYRPGFYSVTIKERETVADIIARKEKREQRRKDVVEFFENRERGF